MTTNAHARWRFWLGLLLAGWALSGGAGQRDPDTDWLRDAGYGVFLHYLPGDDASFARVKEFDVDALAAQVEEAGARYLVITLGQNSGYFIAPNATYDRVTGYRAGERCSVRDLPLDLHRALALRGIRLMLYLPCQVPNQDPRAQRAFGLAEGPADQPLSVAFAGRWAEVIREWSERYGDQVAGWWFDGGYRHIGFNDGIAEPYAAAVKKGNPRAIVTFNPGVSLVRHSAAEDYTAGELNEPFQQVPESRWVDGSQWHALTYLGSGWGQRDIRFPDQRWAEWVTAVVSREGAVTLDVGPNTDPAGGPIGAISTAQLAQLKAIRTAVRDTPPKRLRRADSYFGLHFDFHAGEDCTEVGRNTTREMVNRIIDAARPDYIQVDSKGHAGFTSYPTRVGNPAPGFVGDPLRIWRAVTAERGVALYAHHSGVWDSEAIRRHPEWAVRNADGSTNRNATSFFGGYAEKLLIPQLREMAGEYGLDGAWVDGECWASQPDWSDDALRAFRASSGVDVVPRRAGDPHWFEFLQFNRQAFRRYLRNYLEAVRSTHPDFQLCSNWAFTDHMPEPVTANVNWISGDFSPEDAVNSARFSARYLAHQGRPWDLMAWSFVTKGARPNGDRQKSAVQLQREAAVVLSQGGGFQVYHAQRRDGSVPMEYLPTIRELAAFCRERQPFCQGARPVPQIAFLYSTFSHYREINSLFGRDLSNLAGALQALVEGGQVVDVVGEHSLEGRMKDYRLIVVGESTQLDPDFRARLSDYAAGGGRLLILGPQTAAAFSAELTADIPAPVRATRRVTWREVSFETPGDLAVARWRGPAQTFGLLERAGTDGQDVPAAAVVDHGRGKIAAVLFSFSRGYLGQRSPAMRHYLNALVRELVPDPLVRLTHGEGVDVTVTRVRGQLAVHLVNARGEHWSQERPLIEELPAAGLVTLEIRLERPPTTLRSQPDGKALEFEYRDGVAVVTVPTVPVHSIVTVE